MDTWGPATETSDGNKYVLTIVGVFSHLCMSIPLPSIESHVVAKAFHDHWVAACGCACRRTARRKLLCSLCC